MCSDHWRSLQNLNWQQNAKVWNSNTSCTFVYLHRIIWMTLGKEIFFRSCVCVCACVCFFFQLQTDGFKCTIFRQKIIFPKKCPIWKYFFSKNSSDSQIGLGLRPRPILAVLGIFFIQLFPNWTACSPITYTNPPFHFRPESKTRAKIF